jgi:hypothetical protein
MFINIIQDLIVKFKLILEIEEMMVFYMFFDMMMIQVKRNRITAQGSIL